MLKDKNKQLLLLAVAVIVLITVTINSVNQNQPYLARFKIPTRDTVPTLTNYNKTFDLLEPYQNQAIRGMFVPVRTFIEEAGSRDHPIKRTTKFYDENGRIVEKDIDVYIEKYYIETITSDRDYNRSLRLYDCNNRMRKRAYATGSNSGTEPIGCFDSLHDATPNGRVTFLLVVEASCVKKGSSCFRGAAEDNIHGISTAVDIVDRETAIVYNSRADRERYEEEAADWSSDPSHFGIHFPRSGQEISGEKVPLYITIPVGEGNYVLPFIGATDEDGWLIPSPIDIHSWYIVDHSWYEIPVFDENGNLINQNMGYGYDSQNPTGYFDSTYFNDGPLEILLGIEYKYICGTDEGRIWGCTDFEYLDIAGTRPIVKNQDPLVEEIKERLENLNLPPGRGEEINTDIDVPVRLVPKDTDITDTDIDHIPAPGSPFRKRIDWD